LLIFSACSDKKLPSGVLSKDQMEKIMWDMVQADQYYREYIIKDSASKDIRQARYDLYEEVFKMHKITRATFDNSFEYYSAHPKLMKEVFDSLSVKGNKRLQDFYKSTPTVDSASQRKLRPRLDSLKPR
jgi:hypothetical protein